MAQCVDRVRKSASNWRAYKPLMQYAPPTHSKKLIWKYKFGAHFDSINIISAAHELSFYSVIRTPFGVHIIQKSSVKYNTSGHNRGRTYNNTLQSKSTLCDFRTGNKSNHNNTQPPHTCLVILPQSETFFSIYRCIWAPASQFFKTHPYSKHTFSNFPCQYLQDISSMKSEFSVVIVREITFK